MPLEHWLQLALTDGLGPVLISRAIERFGGAGEACSAGESQWRTVQGIGQGAAAIVESLCAAAEQVGPEMARAQKLGVTLICGDDPAYPAMLKQIPDPPVVLYVKGALEARDLCSIAIVGSRKASHYGQEQAERFASLLAGAGATIVSGGARGIDTCAHRGALSHPRGRTIAVLGSGLDVPYPLENVQLFDQVAARGATISEFPFGTEPRAQNFPRRNRIISGMSRGVLVVEADIRSGALLTARQAIEDHSRPVFAIPGRIDNPLAQGPHKLIREGAILVSNFNEVLDELGPLPSGVVDEPAAGVSSDEPSMAEAIEPDVSDQQRRVLDALDGDALSVDSIVERTDLAAQVVLQELTFLTLKGLLVRTDGQRFARRRKRP